MGTLLSSWHYNEILNIGKYKEEIYLAHTDMEKLPYLTQALSPSRASSRSAHKVLLEYSGLF